MKMIFETPATVWQEAFPLGNGRIGALMFGDGEAETLCLNEDTLWSGYPGDPCTGMGYEDIKKAEVYAKEGKYLQAAQVLNQAQETAEDVEMYEPFGTVRIRFEGEREIADYQRELDLETATARVTYRNRGKSYEHRCTGADVGVPDPGRGSIYHNGHGRGRISYGKQLGRNDMENAGTDAGKK